MYAQTSGTSQLEWAPSGALCGLGAQRDTDRGVGPRRRAGRLRLHRVVRRGRGCTLTRDLVTIRGHYQLFISFIHLEALIHSTLVLMMMTLHEAQKSCKMRAKQYVNMKRKRCGKRQYM